MLDEQRHTEGDECDVDSDQETHEPDDESDATRRLFTDRHDQLELH